jgi:hypothetical protein
MLNGREFFNWDIYPLSFTFLSLSLSLSSFFMELSSLFWDILIRGSEKKYLEPFFRLARDKNE